MEIFMISINGLLFTMLGELKYRGWIITSLVEIQYIPFRFIYNIKGKYNTFQLGLFVSLMEIQYIPVRFLIHNINGKYNTFQLGYCCCVCS